MARAPYCLLSLFLVLVVVLVSSTILGNGTLAVASLFGGFVGGALFTLARDRWEL